MMQSVMIRILKYFFILTFSFHATMARSSSDTERIIYREMKKVEEDREPELCSINLNADLHNLYNKLDTFFEKGFEYECSQIRFKSASEYHGGSRYTYELLVSCTPRKLSEKVLYSMAKRCETDPSEACFDENTLEKMDRVSHTTFIYENDFYESCSTLNDI